MFVGVARLTLQIPDSGSLKAKRQVLRRVTDRVKARFNVSVAEVGANDLWQRAIVGLTVVGNDQRHVNEQLDKIIQYVDDMYVAPLMEREMEIVSFGDRLQGVQDEEEDLQDELPLLEIPRGDRSLAEAEGIAWEDRHEGRLETGRPEKAGAGVRGKGAGKSAGRQGGRLSLEEARAKARSLRNPRDWEKK